MKHNGNPIYVVTMMDDLKINQGDDDSMHKYIVGDFETIGFFHDYEDARLVVENNMGDIYDCSYKYAVIEKIYQGLYPHTTPNEEGSRMFYKYNRDKDKYESIIVPIMFDTFFALRKYNE